MPTDSSRNLIVLAGDRYLAASCDRAINYATGTEIWNAQNDPVLRHHKQKQSNVILMTSCTEIQLDDDYFQDSHNFGIVHVLILLMTGILNRVSSTRLIILSKSECNFADCKLTGSI